MRNRYWLSAIAWLSLAFLCSQTQAIEKAGELVVDVNASTYELGSGTWANAGSYTDFTAVGSPGMITIGDAPAVTFDGTNAFVGSDSPPEDILGFNTRSIEAWVFNPSIASEETVVSWGKRGGPDGTNMAFNYGNHGNFGAVGHWGGGGHDVGWVDNDFTFGAPEVYKWHHLVYTYDEEFTRVYSDGVLQNEEDTFGLWGDLDTHADTAIAIAAQWEGNTTDANIGDPAFLTVPLRGSLGIGQLRVHSGVLTDEQIVANFDEEKALYSVSPQPPAGIEFDDIGQVIPPTSTENPVARPLSASPIHRYSFNSPENFEAGGEELTDSIGGAHGVVVAGTDFADPPEFTGTQLFLPGGESIDAPYGDLPNGLISGLTSATFESWTTTEESQSWSRIWDFGSNSPGGDEGELEGPGDENGGNTEGLDTIFLSAQRGGDTNVHRVEMRNEDPAGGGISTVDFTLGKELGEETHFAVIFDAEATPVLDFLLNPTGEFTPGIKVYADGELVAEGATDIELSDMNDVNNWLGRSNWTNDANFQGSFNEFRIYDYALSGDEVLGSMEAGPDELVVMEGNPLDNDGNGTVDVGDFVGACAAGNAAELQVALGLLPGDIDGGGVAFSDFLILSDNFTNEGVGYAGGDFDCNGKVEFADFLVLSNNFGKSAVASSVPEPTGLLMLLMGLGLFHRLRGKRRHEL